MQRVTLLPVLLILALAGCSADAATDASSLNYGMQPTPFTGSCELVAQPPQPISPGVVRQVNVGDCIVSHLGLPDDTGRTLDLVRGGSNL